MQTEIESIIKKRSDFEHKINARGSLASDYARYLEYEMNLDSLRCKRLKRLGAKTGVRSGPKRIFFLLDRATKKFYGDVRLWIQYADYAKKQKAHSKMSQVLTSMLRLHPAKPELWIYAASYAFDSQGDMTQARSYMQRGLRFCKNSISMWLEYGRFEMRYIAKIVARQRILGLDERPTTPAEAIIGNELDADQILVPKITAEDVDSNLRIDEPSADQSSLKALAATPVLSGDIPIAIFDAAMQHFQEDDLFAERFFDMVAELGVLQAVSKIHSHIAEKLQVVQPKSSAAMSCYVRSPLSGISPVSPDFQNALAVSLNRLNAFLGSTNGLVPTVSTCEPELRLCTRIVPWLLSYLGNQDLDEGIARILAGTIMKVMKQYRELILATGKGFGNETALLVEDLIRRGFINLSSSTITWALEIWPSNAKLQSLQAKALDVITKVE